MKKEGVKLFLKKEILIDLERNGDAIVGGHWIPSKDYCPPVQEQCTSRVLSYVSCLPTNPTAP